MNIWWCNQSNDWDLERPENIVCASDDMLRLNYRKTVGEVLAGDIIVHYKKPRIAAFSRARENGRYYKHLPLVSDLSYGSGWRFATEYHDLSSAPDRSAVMDELARLSRKDYAINANGTVKQGYFLRFDLEGLKVILRHVKEALPRWLDEELQKASLPVPADDITFTEGERCSYFANRYERNPAARDACVDHHGSRCWVCLNDLGEIYGQFMSGFIHVHHIIPLAERGEVYEVNPVKDLRPVCPNCHAALHQKGAPSMDNLRAHFRLQ